MANSKSKREAASHRPVPPSADTWVFGAWAEQHLATVDLKPERLANEESIYRELIEPTFGRLEIGRITSLLI